MGHCVDLVFFKLFGINDIEKEIFIPGILMYIIPDIKALKCDEKAAYDTFSSTFLIIKFTKQAYIVAFFLYFSIYYIISWLFSSNSSLTLIWKSKIQKSSII